MINTIESLFQFSKSTQEFSRGYFLYLSKLLDKFDVDKIAEFINVLLEARESGKTVFFIGNGGSAATASHFANDIGIGTRSTRKPFKIVSLTDNVPVITAIANDYSYDDIFLMQLIPHLQKEDAVVAISASGNSKNVLKAIEYANQKGSTTIGITGFDGGKLRECVKISLHVPTKNGEYGPVEDVHMIFDHLVNAYLIQICRFEKEEDEKNEIK